MKTILVLFLLMARVGWAGNSPTFVALDASYLTPTATTMAVSFTTDASPNMILAAEISYWGAATAISITGVVWDGFVFKRASFVAAGSFTFGSEIWIASGIPNNTASNCTATAGGTIAGCVISILEYSNVLQSTTQGNSASVYMTGSTFAGVSITAQQNDLIIYNDCYSPPNTLSANPGTLRNNFGQPASTLHSVPCDLVTVAGTLYWQGYTQNQNSNQAVAGLELLNPRPYSTTNLQQVSNLQ